MALFQAGQFGRKNGQLCLLLVVGGNRLIRQPQITPCWRGMHCGIELAIAATVKE